MNLEDLMIDAVEAGDTEAIEALLNKGYDINAYYNGYTLLYYALKTCSSEFVEYLINSGADIDQPVCVEPLPIVAQYKYINYH